MVTYSVHGGKPLRGTVAVSGNEDASMAEILIGLYTGDPIILHGVPKTEKILALLDSTNKLGMQSSFVEDVLTVRTKNLVGNFIQDDHTIEYSTIPLFLGPFLNITGEAVLPAKGIEHEILSGLKAFGVAIQESNDTIIARYSKGAANSHFVLTDTNEVSALSLLVFAVCGKGVFVLENVPNNSKVSDMIGLLKKCGAKIDQSSDHTLKIEGVSELHGSEHEVLTDTIEAELFATAALMTGGEIILKRIDWTSFSPFLTKIEDHGGHYDIVPDGIKISGKLQTSLSVNPLMSALALPQESMVELSSGRNDIVEKLNTLGAAITVVEE
jgi:UDP-N-acetylglucosamine 1-carboxyvinyltransferase